MLGTVSQSANVHAHNICNKGAIQIHQQNNQLYLWAQLEMRPTLCRTLYNVTAPKKKCLYICANAECKMLLKMTHDVAMKGNAIIWIDS